MGRTTIATLTLLTVNTTIVATIGWSLARPHRPTTTEGTMPDFFNIGDRVNVLEPFNGAMPDTPTGYLIVATTSYVDTLTGEPRQTCSLTEADPRDFSSEFLTLAPPPE